MKINKIDKITLSFLKETDHIPNEVIIRILNAECPKIVVGPINYCLSFDNFYMLSIIVIIMTTELYPILINIKLAIV